RVQQTYKHSVPRFFVPEHGTMFTLALVRFPPTATKEIQYLNGKGALTYTDIAGDPVLYGNLPPREISMKDVFRSGDSSKKAINNVFRKFSAFHDETGRLNVDGMNIISNDGSNKLNRSRKARVSY